MEDAVAWAAKSPDPSFGGEGEIEVRQIFEDEDFGDEFTPELREQEQRVRAQAAENQH